MKYVKNIETLRRGLKITKPICLCGYFSSLFFCEYLSTNVFTGTYICHQSFDHMLENYGTGTLKNVTLTGKRTSKFEEIGDKIISHLKIRVKTYKQDKCRILWEE